MFWLNDDFVEEEWSLSAKLLGGLVFNPFSLANHPDPHMFKWFVNRVTCQELADLTDWRAKPEYRGPIGRNDWRVQADQITIIVECKFGDGIDPETDCLQYMMPSGQSRTWMVIVASVSELAELTRIAQGSSEPCRLLREAIQNHTVRLMAWHEIVEAFCRYITDDSVKTILSRWAASASRNWVRVLPENTVSGIEFEDLIINGKTSNIIPVHRPDARGIRGPTSSLDEVLTGTRFPDWVAQILQRIQEQCSEKCGVFEPKKKWVNIRRNKTSPSVTIVPWADGVTFVVSHPPKEWRPPSPPLLPMTELKGCRMLPVKESWFPQNRTVGWEIVDPVEADLFVRKCMTTCRDL